MIGLPNNQVARFNAEAWQRILLGVGPYVALGAGPGNEIILNCEVTFGSVFMHV